LLAQVSQYPVDGLLLINASNHFGRPAATTADLNIPQGTFS
jgi:hypothetical protein